jgi:hypothetical protein
MRPHVAHADQAIGASCAVRSAYSRVPACCAVRRVLCAAVVAQSLLVLSSGEVAPESSIGRWGAKPGAQLFRLSSGAGACSRLQDGPMGFQLICRLDALRGGGTKKWGEPPGGHGGAAGGMVWGKDRNGFPILVSGEDANKTDADRNHEATSLSSHSRLAAVNTQAKHCAIVQSHEPLPRMGGAETTEPATLPAETGKLKPFRCVNTWKWSLIGPPGVQAIVRRIARSLLERGNGQTLPTPRSPLPQADAG